MPRPKLQQERFGLDNSRKIVLIIEFLSHCSGNQEDVDPHMLEILKKTFAKNCVNISTRGQTKGGFSGFWLSMNL